MMQDWVEVLGIVSDEQALRTRIFLFGANFTACPSAFSYGEGCSFYFFFLGALGVIIRNHNMIVIVYNLGSGAHI